LRFFKLAETIELRPEPFFGSFPLTSFFVSGGVAAHILSEYVQVVPRTGFLESVRIVAYIIRIASYGLVC